MRIILLLITLVQISSVFIKSYAQTAIVPRQTIFYENFSGPMVIGSFPLNDNSFITTEGDPLSFQTNINAVSTFVGVLNDIKIQDTIYSQNGIHINTISGGLGPYSYIENDTDTKLMLSLSDKVYAVQFGLNTITSTSSNLLIYYEVELTEASSPVTGYNFLQYRTDPAGSWNEVPGTTYSSFGKSVGDVVTFSGITLPTCLSGTDYVEFRWITFQDGAVDIMNGDVLSFSIDNIKIDPSPALPQLSSSLLTICGSGSLTFSLVNSSNPFQYRWYNSSMNLLSITSTNFKTPLLTSSQDFYVEAYNGSCTSAIVKMTATVYTVPGIPALDAATQTICGSNTFTFNVQSAIYSHYYWYNTSVSGVAITDNSQFSTPSLTNQTNNYWVEANDGFCASTRLKAAATAYPIPVTPILTNSVASICGTGTITFTLQSTSEPFYHWYDAASGGSLIGINTSYTTPSAYNTVSNVWVESSNGHCISSPLVQGTANFYRLPDVPLPLISLRTICGTGSLTFNVQNIESYYNWYDTSVGGISLIESISYSTPSFYNSTITKWVEAFTGICYAPRVSVVGISFRTPATPVIDNNVKSICGAGTITFGLQSTPEPTYRWLNAAIGGTIIGSNTTYTTPTINNQVIDVWVRAFDGICSSPRVQVTGTSYRLPDAPLPINSLKTICGTSTLTFDVQNIEAYYNWYDTSIGGVSLIESPSYTSQSFYNSTITKWVEAFTGICYAPRVSVVGVSYRTPVSPVLTNSIMTICGTGTITFSLQAPPEPFYRWYNTSVGGTLLSTLTSYITPPSYDQVVNVWVRAFDGTCSSPRIQSTATFYRIPGAPVLDNGVKEICDLNPITFNVQNSTEPHYFWYHTITGGSLLTDNPSYTTPSFYNKSDTAWVEGNSGYCTGPRSMAIGIYNRIPVVPILDNTNKSICGTGVITFNIQNTVESAYRWFDDASGNNLLVTDVTYSTPSFNNSIKNVWVESYTGKCSSARVNAVATSYRIPEVPVLDQSVKTICGTSTFIFNVNNIEPTYKWYDTNGAIRASGISASTISLYNQSDTLFVEANTPTCFSSKVMAIGISKSIPALPIVVNPSDSLCGPGEITFHLTSTGSVLSYRWFDSAKEETELTATTDYRTPYLTASANYWVDAFDGICFTDRVNTFAKIKAVPDPTITISNQVLTATPLAAQYQWYIGALDKPAPQGVTNTLQIRYSGAYYVKLTNSNGCEILSYYNFLKAGGDTIYYEGFQSGMPGDYTIVNGDNAKVQNVADYYTLYGNTPWAVIPATKDAKNPFFGGVNNQVASATSIFANKKINANRWMITDTIELNHEGLNHNDLINSTTFSFQWKAASDDGGDFPDSYDVLISSTSKDTSAFTILLSIKRESISPVLRIINPLSKSYNGQKVFFAFRLSTPHYSGNRLMIDDIMVIASTTGITGIKTFADANIEKDLSISIYPNPADEQIIMDYNVLKPTSVKLYLYDLIGNIIAEKNFGFVNTGSYSHELDLKAYPKGMYFIKMVSDSESEMVRLIIR